MHRSHTLALYLSSIILMGLYGCQSNQSQTRELTHLTAPRLASSVLFTAVEGSGVYSTIVKKIDE